MIDFGKITLESPWRFIRIQTKESVVILAHFACCCSLPVPVQMGGAESVPASANPQDGDAPQLALAAIEHNAANDLEKIIREFWQNRGAEGATVQKEVGHLRTLLFRKKKRPVEQDLWIPCASQPGVEQHVEAVVSEVFVLNQIKEAIEFRETWLQQNDLPMNCQMRDKEKMGFLQWAKKQYHAGDFQQKRQQEDFDRGGNSKVKKGKNSRWSRELQRRLGTPALWYMVCFTGRFNVTFLQTGDDSIQTVAHKQEPTQDLTRQAQRARDRLRWAERLQRKKSKGNKKFTIHEQGLFVDLREGKLHDAANDATRKDEEELS